MNLKNSGKYFTQKSNYPLLVISILIIVIGVFCILFDWIIYLGATLAIIGFIIISIYEGAHISNKEIDSLTEKEFKFFKESFKQRYIISQHMHKQVIDKSICIENTTYNFAYDFEHQDSVVLKGSDGKYRSSRCQMNAVLISDRYLIIEVINFSLTESNRNEKNFKLKYENLLPLEIIEFDDTSVSCNKYKKLKIKTHDNSENFEIIIPNDAENQRYLDRINKKINL